MREVCQLRRRGASRWVAPALAGAQKNGPLHGFSHRLKPKLNPRIFAGHDDLREPDFSVSARLPTRHAGVRRRSAYATDRIRFFGARRGRLTIDRRFPTSRTLSFNRAVFKALAGRLQIGRRMQSCPTLRRRSAVPPKAGQNRRWMPQTQTHTHTVNVLKAIPLFAALDSAELDSLAACAGRRTYPAGELLFSEGEPCAGLYI